ncbi:hypothetical protein POI8812_02272 [Pontivivens insulae]|uniref:Uncharacterized protein n=1 Tax=Pontivivens insulae TaxID=1639689 RepID=A0A2R8ACF6_9RHOB|nr:hypothetical protein DFR53_1218 [Pontivivens insulae]SPF29946.1 hypothetical protein POI8812_02272 [Pontivivens insulae]
MQFFPPLGGNYANTEHLIQSEKAIVSTLHKTGTGPVVSGETT